MRKSGRRARYETPFDPDATQPVSDDSWGDGEVRIDLTNKVDSKAPVWMAVAFVAIVLALCLSGAAWVIVSIWKDILA